jgi:hypothetical protein
MQLPTPITNPWFKPKTYGWGWTPANLKGWLTTIALVIFIFANTASYIQINEKPNLPIDKLEDYFWMVNFNSTIQLIINSFLALTGLLTITKLTSSKK